MNTQAQTVPVDIFRRVTGLSIGLAVLMIVLGFAAIFKPFAAGLSISLFIAWIIVFSGVVHIVYAFAARSAGSFLWRTLIGVAYIVGGMYLLKNPSIALASFTLMLAVIPADREYAYDTSWHVFVLSVLLSLGCLWTSDVYINWHCARQQRSCSSYYCDYSAQH